MAPAPRPRPPATAAPASGAWLPGGRARSARACCRWTSGGASRLALATASSPWMAARTAPAVDVTLRITMRVITRSCPPRRTSRHAKPRAERHMAARVWSTAVRWSAARSGCGLQASALAFACRATLASGMLQPYALSLSRRMEAWTACVVEQRWTTMQRSIGSSTSGSRLWRLARRGALAPLAARVSNTEAKTGVARFG
mmetsp:Transcript_21546/g.61017  ORF Transcript_21546/g.61017 Transcript_21546/m.61017 type:complete len:200 (-) Transcript_21546:972-1571(-)